MKTKLVICLAVLAGLFLCPGAQAFYKPSTGAWLNRDPFENPNPHNFVGNNALSRYDFLGLWGSEVHYERTRQWAGEMGVASMTAGLIASMDNSIDLMFDPTQLNDRNFSWHFNRSANPNEDSRLKHKEDEVKAAKEFCTWSIGHDDAPAAAMRLGYSLHPLQDWVAHGDFDRKSEAPSLTGVGVWESRHYWHNWDAGGWWTAKQVDDPSLDANGPDGRATFAVMHLGTILSNGDMTFWTRFHPGSQRIDLTERLTKEVLSDFKSYVAQDGKPCGACWKAFLGGGN